jgi:hypothetical protein
LYFIFFRKAAKPKKEKTSSPETTEKENTVGTSMKYMVAV